MHMTKIELGHARKSTIAAVDIHIFVFTYHIKNIYYLLKIIQSFDWSGAMDDIVISDR